MIDCMAPLQKQASCNSCSANAVATGYEYVMNRFGKNASSRLFIYYNARARDIKDNKDKENEDERE